MDAGRGGARGKTLSSARVYRAWSGDVVVGAEERTLGADEYFGGAGVCETARDAG